MYSFDTNRSKKSDAHRVYNWKTFFSLFIYDMWNYNGATEINLTKQEIEQIATWTKTS